MKIETAMKVHLPWADEIVKGRFPILIRKVNTRNRGFVGVMCSQSFDGLALSEDCTPDIYEEYFGNLIGLIEISDVKKIPGNQSRKELSSTAGKRFADWYPSQFIPSEEEVYFWYLRNPKKFKKPFQINRRGGFIWTRLTPKETESVKRWK